MGNVATAVQDTPPPVPKCRKVDRSGQRSPESKNFDSGDSDSSEDLDERLKRFISQGFMN